MIVIFDLVETENESLKGCKNTLKWYKLNFLISAHSLVSRLLDDLCMYSYLDLCDDHLSEQITERRGAAMYLCIVALLGSEMISAEDGLCQLVNCCVLLTHEGGWGADISYFKVLQFISG